MGENFFSLQYYYNKKPYQRQGNCDTYLTVYIYLRNTLSLVNMQSVSTVQNTISKPMLFMIFYWQKFFYLKNIQRSFLVRCRLGKLAVFIYASLATLAQINLNITALNCSNCSVLMLLISLIISHQFAAHTVYNLCVFNCSYCSL